MGEKEAKSSRCCLVGVCKYFLFCYPLGKDSSNLGEQRRPKAPAPAPAPCAPGGGGGLRRVPRLPRLQVATGSGSQRSVIARAQGRVGGGRGGRRRGTRGYKRCAPRQPASAPVITHPSAAQPLP